jgi:SAM-dependent methyltransferase
MSLSSSFFTWVQGAGFYRALYAEAVEMLPPGNGERWTDIGCGPGLMVRLASRRGYQSEGIDSSPDMLQAARLLAKKERIEARFTTGSLETLGNSDAAVLSIASLLSLQADVRAGLNHLWKALKPDGRLLIVEPTDRISPRRARGISGSSLPGPRRTGASSLGPGPGRFGNRSTDSQGFRPGTLCGIRREIGSGRNGRHLGFA